MRWTGKLLGALVGSAAGPIGALLGALLGHGFDAHEEERAGFNPALVQRRWFDTAFAVMGFVAKSDGRVSEREIDAARTIMRYYQLGEEDVQRAIAAFTRGKQPDYPVEGELAELVALCGRRHPLLQAFLEVQLLAVLVGDGLDGTVRELLVRIAARLGFSQPEVYQLEAYLRQRTGPGRGTATPADRPGALAEAYEVLGIGASASDAEVKKAYRRLMSENHPDKLVARGLPESMQELAKQKTQRIREAYEIIAADRGLR